MNLIPSRKWDSTNPNRPLPPRRWTTLHPSRIRKPPHSCPSPDLLKLDQKHFVPFFSFATKYKSANLDMLAPYNFNRV